jgi:hypothetical protein
MGENRVKANRIGGSLLALFKRFIICLKISISIKKILVFLNKKDILFNSINDKLLINEMMKGKQDVKIGIKEMSI